MNYDVNNKYAPVKLKEIVESLLHKHNWRKRLCRTWTTGQCLVDVRNRLGRRWLNLFFCLTLWRSGWIVPLLILLNPNLQIAWIPKYPKQMFESDKNGWVKCETLTRTTLSQTMPIFGIVQVCVNEHVLQVDDDDKAPSVNMCNCFMSFVWIATYADGSWQPWKLVWKSVQKYMRNVIMNKYTYFVGWSCGHLKAVMQYCFK